MKRVNIELNLDSHRKAKSQAALKGILLKDFIRQAINEKINRELDDMLKEYENKKKVNKK